MSSTVFKRFLQKRGIYLRKQGPPGPPPRQGLQWKPQTHRWIRPASQSGDDLDSHFKQLNWGLKDGIKNYLDTVWTDPHYEDLSPNEFHSEVSKYLIEDLDIAFPDKGQDEARASLDRYLEEAIQRKNRSDTNTWGKGP